jgi:hypothetical protein
MVPNEIGNGKTRHYIIHFTAEVSFGVSPHNQDCFLCPSVKSKKLVPVVNNNQDVKPSAQEEKPRIFILTFSTEISIRSEVF